MIDLNARQIALDLLEDWFSGRISNFDLEDHWPTSEVDDSIESILDRIWLLYNDGEETKLSASCLSQKQSQLLSRIRENATY